MQGTRFDYHYLEYPFDDHVPAGRILVILPVIGRVAEIRVHLRVLVASQALMQMVGRSAAEEAGEVI
jgi:hypothetical protein